jgi:hypothetical protein
MGEIVAFVLGLIGNLLASEFLSWMPTVASRLVKIGAGKLPSPLSERMLEEWEALLYDTPAPLGKLCVALSLVLALPKIRHEYYNPGTPYRPLAHACIRIIDISIATIALILVAPLFLLIAALLKCVSRDPIFETRIYKDKYGRRLRVLRFRTWQVKHSYSDQNWVGAFLAKYSLHELPELWSVLKGDMSLIRIERS